MANYGIIFLDVIEFANVYDINGSKDENIETAVIDNKMLNELMYFQRQNPNAVIVAASQFAKLVLDRQNITSYYPRYGLISGFQKANNNWDDIFDKYLQPPKVL